MMWTKRFFYMAHPGTMLTLLCRMVLTTAPANEACMVQGFTLQVQVARATSTLAPNTFCCGCDCERTLIIARVALGDAVLATETRYDERRPPVRSNSSGTHDSIVVYPGPIRGHHRQNQVHQEYVIFDREQAYPSYVVQYEL